MADASHKNAGDNKGPNILVPMWALTALTTIIVVARVWIRTRVVKNLGPDDWLIMVSMVLGLIYVAITTANVIVGYGRHAFTLDIPHLEKAILLNTIGFLFGILSFTVPKIAVATMLTRILNPSKLHRLFVFFLVGLSAAVSVICIIILFTMCDPARAMWTVTMTNAKCRDQYILINYAIFTGALSAFVDLYLALYPAAVLWKLKMSLRKKVALTAALGLGAVATAMAIVKCTQLPGLADKSDYTYGTWQLVIWTNIESDVVILASCIPTLQPLLELIMGKRKIGSSSNSRYFNRLDKDSRPMNSHSIEMKSKRSNKQHTVSITNVESQESILQADEHARQHTALGQIRRTDDVRVQYESRDDVASKETTRGW